MSKLNGTDSFMQTLAQVKAKHSQSKERVKTKGNLTSYLLVYTDSMREHFPQVPRTTPTLAEIALVKRFIRSVESGFDYRAYIEYVVAAWGTSLNKRTLPFRVAPVPSIAALFSAHTFPTLCAMWSAVSTGAISAAKHTPPAPTPPSVPEKGSTVPPSGDIEKLRKQLKRLARTKHDEVAYWKQRALSAEQKEDAPNIEKSTGQSPRVHARVMPTWEAGDL